VGIAVDAKVALQDALRTRDEERHAYVSYSIPDEDGPVDDEWETDDAAPDDGRP
jgi:hypothetical protein